MNGNRISPTPNHVPFPNFFASHKLTLIHTNSESTHPTICATTGIGTIIINGANTHRPGLPAFVVITNKLCPEISASYHWLPIFLKTKHREMINNTINAKITTPTPANHAKNAIAIGSIDPVAPYCDPSSPICNNSSNPVMLIYKRIKTTVLSQLYLSW